MSASSKGLLTFSAVLTLEEPAVLEIQQVERPAPQPGFQFHHIPELDGFRGAAILCVIAGHCMEFHSGSARVRALGSSVAQTGVLLFFVLSGFLITGLLCRERERTGSINFRAFYARRILRLAPALLLFLASVMVLAQFGRITDVTKRELLECVFYARNIFGHSMSLGHIWSLSLEEQFYLIWPLTLFLLPNKRGPAIVAVVCAGFMVWRCAAIALQLFPYERGAYYIRPYFRFDSILIGALIALLFYSSTNTYHRLRASARRWSPGLLLAALTVWALFAELALRSIYLTVAEILVAALLGQVVLSDCSWLAAPLRHRWLRYVGTISYSLYLWQELFLTENQPSWGRFRQFPLALLTLGAVALFSYYVIERPALRFKDRLTPQVQ